MLYINVLFVSPAGKLCFTRHNKYLKSIYTKIDVSLCYDETVNGEIINFDKSFWI